MEWTNAYGMEQLGVFIAKTRRDKGYTQDRFADVVGVSHATISALENGKGVSTKTLERALQLLGLKLVVLPKEAVAGITSDPFAPKAELTQQRQHTDYPTKKASCSPKSHRGKSSTRTPSCVYGS